MSLFSRLEERMRTRDAQDDSKEKEKSSSDQQSGGLFGSIQLKPADGEPGVPPPPAASNEAGDVAARRVPSLEEARAEWDRARANEQSAGLFGRAKSEETNDGATTFGAVSLPPRVQADAAPAPLPLDKPAQEPELDIPTENVASEKTFRVPSLSQFAEDEDAPRESEGNSARPAPDIAKSHEVREEQVVYAPIPFDVRESSSVDPASVVAEREPAPALEAMRPAENPPVAPIVTPVAAVAMSVDAPAFLPADETETAFSARDEERANPAPRPSSSANLTPFQRLMAARAAQAGPPIPRPRNDRSMTAATPPARPVVEETKVAEIAEVEPESRELPETQSAVPVVETPQIEAPREFAAPLEPSTAEPLSVDAPEKEAPQVETSEFDGAATPDSEDSGRPDSNLLQVARNQDEPIVAPVVTLESPMDSSNEPAEIESELESPISQSVEPAPEKSGPQDAMSNSQSPTMDDMAAKVEDIVARHRTGNVAVKTETSVQDGVYSDAPQPEESEAETVPEEVVTAALSEDEGLPRSMPLSEIADHEVRPALSLSERLARAPRAELDAAHAEAEALTPEILNNSANSPGLEPPAPRAAPLSFAERLAARNRLQNEDAPAVAASSVTSTITPPVAEAPIAETPVVETPQAVSAPTNPIAERPATPPTPIEEPTRTGPRSFSERLAARTGLDRHLQVPTEESAPISQGLATHNTELARINEGAELSEREMKNRVLFRQKHLIFDGVIGSLDPKTLQNPTRETVKPQIEKGVDAALRDFNLNLEQSERNWLVDEFVREVTDLGALVPMLEDPSVSKIVVTGANDVSVERLGRIERTGVSFRDDDHLLSLVRRIAEMSGGRVDAKVPLLDRPLPDGGRIRAKVPPLAPQPTLTIEKSTGNPFVVLKRQMVEKSRGDSLPYAQLRERIQQRLLREFEGDAASLAGDQDKLRLQVEEMINSVIAEEHVAVTRAERASLVMDLLNEIVGLGPIEPLLNDPDVDEVMVNGPYQIYVERKGKLELTTQRFRDNAHVMQVIDRIVAPLGRRVDEKSPMVDGRLRDGSRFNAIIPPLALSGPTMTIRKFARDPFTMSDLINFGTMTREAAQFLQAAVEGRLNIVVSGGTGSGKTTTLNVLSSFIPSTERIVTIEDAAELQMRQEHVIRMETRPPNIEGVGEVGIRDLVKNSLRMRPDRIVVGECRGGEALDMLQAMNTGHDGSLTTAHSNGPRDTCKRLETMVMMAGFDLPVRAIREQISMAVQLVVHQERMRDGKRRVTAITEIVGMEGDVLTLQDIFRFEHEGMDDDGRLLGTLQATGMRPKYYETMVDNGVQLSMDIFHPKPQEAAPRARLNERGGR